MAEAKKIQIIGIGEDGMGGLTDSARRLIEDADLILGEGHCLALVPDTGAARFVVGTNLDEALTRIEDSPAGNTVVLASGDPLFYGVARYLSDKLGKNRFEVIPHVSSMQLAFARVKESWEEAFLTNLASHGVESVLEAIRTAEKVGLFTSDSYPPPVVARILLDNGLDYFTAYVCENLGSPDERVTHDELAEIAEQQFASLNVMILVRKPHMPDRPSESVGRRLFGNPDEVFLQSKPKRGLLTPAEIRTMALAEMDLGPASVVWDVGAGSGSVAVEAAQICTSGTIYAIEMDPEDHQLIVENAKRFKVMNLVPILGRAPEAWRDLPDPDAVFIGGSGRGIWRLVDAAFRRLPSGGRLVATMGSIDNLAEVHRVLRGHGPDVKVWMINVARGNYQLERVRFESLNPIFLVSVAKPS
ncbi:MAG: precorrin-6y C5,15-methyltransferase (decarboxylating) subunit CbiE [Rhodopirellula sp.]|nr:precorrin-6y C5,15-methyltransferase (decarboxylating) subunit CbiE [Rhodopirellula sp.]